MEDKSCTSSETGQHLLIPNVQLAQLWTKNVKHMPNFTHTHIEKHLILEKEKLPDKKPADAIKYTKKWIQIIQSRLCFDFEILIAMCCFLDGNLFSSYSDGMQ